MKEGYRRITLKPDDEFVEMAHADRRCYEHRYVMAQHVGRPLTRAEQVHHKAGRRENDIENLELVSAAQHCYIHYLERLLTELELKLEWYEYAHNQFNTR